MENQNQPEIPRTVQPARPPMTMQRLNKSFRFAFLFTVVVPAGLVGVLGILMVAAGAAGIAPGLAAVFLLPVIWAGLVIVVPAWLSALVLNRLFGLPETPIEPVEVLQPSVVQPVYVSGEQSQKPENKAPRHVGHIGRWAMIYSLVVLVLLFALFAVALSTGFITVREELQRPSSLLEFVYIGVLSLFFVAVSGVHNAILASVAVAGLASMVTAVWWARQWEGKRRRYSLVVYAGIPLLCISIAIFATTVTVRKNNVQTNAYARAFAQQITALKFDTYALQDPSKWLVEGGFILTPEGSRLGFTVYTLQKDGPVRSIQIEEYVPNESDVACAKIADRATNSMCKNVVMSPGGIAMRLTESGTMFQKGGTAFWLRSGDAREAVGMSTLGELADALQLDKDHRIITAQHNACLAKHSSGCFVVQ